MVSGPAFERWLMDRERDWVVTFLRKRAVGLAGNGSPDAQTVEVLARDIEQGKHRP